MGVVREISQSSDNQERDLKLYFIKFIAMKADSLKTGI